MAKEDKPIRISEYFGCDTFNFKVMEEKLPRETYKKLLKIINDDEKLDADTANTVAHAMKEWALDKGATHYCHWFQPMTGSTAEKHDAFVDPVGPGEVIERFSGKQLVQGEPDASSFPSGGIRATFEARGYTAWDITSPAFIQRSGTATTLCIPTAFISYTGEALDKKTPLLRSVKALSESSVKLLNLLGSTAKKVITTVGPEQEYFLIDKNYFMAREDLVMSGRTLIGSAPSRGQQLEDHYFGSIKEKIVSYMNDVEEELYRLGVPAKTRHNEVAPSQFELAPVFEEANVAVDHNHIVMETLKIIAAKYDMALLLHEKPFAGINGSGKHLNWSMSDNEGNNLLNPGNTPHDNLQFLVVLTAVIRAVFKNADILRATVASPGNDHRLGANEAPPAIISIFLGDQLTSIVESIMAGKVAKATDQAILDLGVSSLPILSKDNTDRNRTSPFAFTGNKFEFRAVGSNMSISFPATAINAMVAESIDYMYDTIKAKGGDVKQAAFDVMKDVLNESKNVLFMGDGYSEEWQTEAAKRGLPNYKTSPEALKAFNTDKAKKLFSKYKILSEKELTARYYIHLERYAKIVDIEAVSLYNMAISQILPASVKYQNDLASSIKKTSDILGADAVKDQKDLLASVAAYIGEIKKGAEKLNSVTKEAHKVEGEQAHAEFYCSKVKDAMNSLRENIDALEKIADNDLWPLPKYWEMLFLN